MTGDGFLSHNGRIFFIYETKKVRGAKHNSFADTEIKKGIYDRGQFLLTYEIIVYKIVGQTTLFI